ncbi:MAG TPA: phosphopantetheine-binding protein, partial [Bacillota bacterium]|nr:phosphopantetheine-binding protein [Bacillota bacterium]
KIRGFRIELTEIENTLRAHPQVQECVVAPWEKQPGQTNLVAYVALEKSQAPDSGVTPPDSNSLQSFLEKTLPEYMVPRIFVFLEALPLSPNGKINRKTLPAPVLTKSEGYLAPQSEAEKILAEIWKEELGLSQVGLNDNFFAIGGHSLLLTRVHNRIQKAFQRDFPLIDLFTHSTLSALARYVVSGQAQPAFLQNEDRLQKQKEAKLKRKQLIRGAHNE